MGNLIIADVLFLFFSIYVGIFFMKFHTAYPKMRVGFHIWEVCYNEKTWYYGNKFAGKVSIGLGLVFFALIYPFLLYLGIKKYLIGTNALIFLLIIFIILFFVLLLNIVRFHLRKKFNLKDEKDDDED